MLYYLLGLVFNLLTTIIIKIIQYVGISVFLVKFDNGLLFSNFNQILFYIIVLPYRDNKFWCTILLIKAKC